MSNTENFDMWSDDVQWAIATVSTLVPKELWAPRAEVRIQWGEYTIENAELFFKRLMEAMREQAAKIAAEQVIEQFGKMLSGYHDIFESSERMLREKLEEAFHVKWDEYMRRWYNDK